MGFEVGDLIQGGSYPELVWRVTHVNPIELLKTIRIRPLYGPSGSDGWNCSDVWVPMKDFEPANEMEVLAWSVG